MCYRRHQLPFDGAMVNANNKMDSTDFSTTNCPLETTIDTPPMLRTPRKNGVRPFKYKSYNLKKKLTFVNVNHLQNENSMVADFCKLVCKPMTVRLTRLPDSELRRLTTRVLPKTVPIRRTPIKRPLFRFYGRGKKKRILTQIQNNKINTIVDNNANNNVHKNVFKNVPEKNDKYVYTRHQLQVKSASKVQKSSNHEQCKEDLLKTVKQPIITLYRIDKVFNKLAQSLAKVATNKQNHTVEQPIVAQNIAVTQTEDVGIMSTSKSDCSWKGRVDDNVSEADSDDLSQVRWISRRKRKLFNESSDESDTDQLHEEPSIQTNMLKLSSLQKETGDTSEKCNVLHRNTPVKIKRLKLSLPQSVTAKTADKHTDGEEVKNPLHGYSSKESIETGIVNDETFVENEHVNLENENVTIENNKVGVQEPLVQHKEGDLGIENIEVDNREERINVEYTKEEKKEERINVDNIRVKNNREERINVDNIRVKNREERINIESMQAVEALREMNAKIGDINVGNANVDIENVDFNVEGVDVDVENEVTNIENIDADVHREDVDVESEEMHAKSDEIDIETANTWCSMDASENAVQVSTKNSTGDGASSLLPTEVSVVHNSRECTNSKPVDELVREAAEIQQHRWKRSISENEFTQKYKLRKQVKILLVDLQHIKSSFGNKYSAAEVEKLTQRNIDMSPNCNSICTTQNLLISGVAHSENIVGRLEPNDNIAESNVCSTASESSIKSTDLNKSPCSENIIGRKGTIERERLSNTVLTKGKLYKMTSDGAIGCSVSSHLPERSIKELGLFGVKESTTRTRSSSPRKSGKLLIVFKPKGSAANAKAPSDTSDIVTDKDFSNTIENLHLAGHRSFTTKDQSKDVSVRNQKTVAKKITLISVPATSSTKYEKHTEKKDSSKSNEFYSNYKCIVCDLYFEDYSVLQQHLSKHAKQQLPSLSPKYTVSEKRGNIEDILQSPPLVPEGQTLLQTPMDTTTCQVAPPSDGIADNTVLLHKRSQKKLKPVKHKNSSSKKKVLKPCKLSDECSVCSQEFSTRADLAAHIFLHSESELQRAYEAAKLKRYEEIRHAKSETQRTEDTVANAADLVEKSSTNTNECEISTKAQTAQNQNKQTSEPTAVKVPEEVKETDPKTSKPTCGESNSNNHVSSVINKIEKAKTTKKGGSSKTFLTICQCHNKADMNFSYLQIEIVLLCHTCKVLFRSMECFETHYRLPEYSACNQNRLESGRSPNLFCATCGMIFSSDQDVRQHLEMHVRFKKNCTMDFRCNICKVMFIGIGSIFYLHWFKHTKDSFWVASEQSFPKMSLFIPKSKKQGETYKPGEFIMERYLDNYIYVAEYICFDCKVVFTNKDHLKTHLLNCRADTLAKNQIVESNGTEIRQLELKLICSLCEYHTFSKVELYAHMKNKHKFASEPQFLCVPLRTMATTFICRICMEINEDIDKFNEHWLSHYVKQPYFVCIYCNKDSDSVDALKEHVKEHELAIRQNIISCKVKYRDVEHICKVCHVGVESKKLLNEHNAIHNLNDLNRRKSNEVTTEKDILQRMLEAEEPDKENEATVNQAVGCSKSVTDRDKEKLINILEGNEEEDSENELVIDLGEHPENESAVKDRSIEKNVPPTLPALMLPAPTLPAPTLPAPTLSAPTLPAPTFPAPTLSAPTLPAPTFPAPMLPAPISPASTLPAAMLPGPTLPAPMLPASTLPAPTLTASTLAAPTLPAPTLTASTLAAPTLPAPTWPTITLNDALDSETQAAPQNVVQSENVIVVENESQKDEESIKEVEASEPTKKKHGFLRVKALTELLEDTSSLFICQTCNYSCDSAESLRQHHLTHIPQKQPQPFQPEIPVFQAPVSSIEQSRLVNKTFPEKSFVATGRTVQIPFLSRLYPGTATNAKVLAAKPNPVVSSAQASTKTAYHKNLPACNIVRKIIVSRSSLQTNGNVPTATKRSSSNAQTTQKVSTVDFNSTNQRGAVTSVTNSNKNPSGNLPLTANMATVADNSYTKSKICTKHHLRNSRAHDSPKYPQTQHIKNGLAEKSHNVGGGVAMRNSNITNGNQNYNQIQCSIQNQARINPSATVYYKYPNSEHVYAEIGQGAMQNQQAIRQVPSHTVTTNLPPAYYYKNPAAGGMSIVINQAPPTVSNLSTMDIRQQQGHQTQIYQPVYTNPVMSVDSYAQQLPQNIIDYSGTGEVYQVSSNEYRGPITEHITACGRTLEASANLICPYCPNSVTFTNQDMFKLHISVSHNFICDLCGLMFHNIDDIRIHKIKHGLMDN